MSLNSLTTKVANLLIYYKANEMVLCHGVTIQSRPDSTLYQNSESDVNLN